MIRIKGRDESWVPLAVNKFDSTRKRMSIVVKDKHGNIRLLCKGADSGMLGRGTCGGKQESETLIEHLKVTHLSAHSSTSDR
jgi:magnesium-transporting ATPase (P-type)